MNEEHPQRRTSDILAGLAEGDPAERVTIGEIDLVLEERSFGLSMVIFALPCCVPTPPGIATVCGIILALIAIQIVAQRPRLWLPTRLARRGILRGDLARVLDRVLPRVRWFEKYCRPRAPPFTGRVAETAVGIVVVILGIVLILPIPLLGTLPPGFAIVILALGLLEQDGVVVAAGILASLIAFILGATMTWAAILGILQLF